MKLGNAHARSKRFYFIQDPLSHPTNKLQTRYLSQVVTRTLCTVFSFAASFCIYEDGMQGNVSSGVIFSRADSKIHLVRIKHSKRTIQNPWIEPRGGRIARHVSGLGSRTRDDVMSRDRGVRLICKFVTAKLTAQSSLCFSENDLTRH